MQNRRAHPNRRLAAFAPLLIAAVLMAGGMTGGAPTAAAAAVDLGDVQISFEQVKRANLPATRALRKSGRMEAVATEVNRLYALPRNLPVLFSDQLDVGPAYLPNVKLQDGTRLSFINFPGSFLTTELQVMRGALRGVEEIRPQQAMIAANQFVLAHEIGHALVDQLRIPITGKEEDAVDGFAAYLLAKNESFGPMTAISAALFFAAVATDPKQLRDEDFADEHSLNQQRAYQFLCWVYGSDRRRFRGLVGRGMLPAARAVRCGAEWKQVNYSWSQLLAPHLRDPLQQPVPPPKP